jgi:hypothetical protein
MNTPTPESPKPDPFIEAARKRIEDGRLLHANLCAHVDRDEDIDNWIDLPTGVQSFWIDLAASVRASESHVELDGRRIAQNQIGARP